MQDGLDDIVTLWDGHRIRKNKQDHVTHGRPLTMYQLPQVYGTRDYLLPVDQRRIQLCESEIVNKKKYPCDEDLFNYCCLVMESNRWTHPETPEEAAHLYINLRGHMRRTLF